MNCPACGAPLSSDVLAPCGACGFPAADLRMGLVRLYFVTGSFFLTTLLYAAVAALVRVHPPAAVAGSVLQYLPFLGLVLAAVLFLVTLRWADTPEDLSPQQALQKAILQATLAETPAVLGLVCYLLTGQLRDFAVLLAAALALFVLLGMRMPRLALSMRRYLCRQWEANKRNGQ
ncbi:MAG TPA: hypothetical protein VGM19_11370 [Armatimonadota bacterium]|jgi:hypothetical protein